MSRDPATDRAAREDTYAEAYDGTPVYGHGRPGEGLLGEMNLQRFLVILRRKWAFMAGTMVFALVAALYVILTSTPVYETHSLIEILLRRPRIMAQSDAVIQDQGVDYSGKAFNTQVQKLKGHGMREAALRSFHEAQPDNDISDEDLLGTFRIHLKPINNSRLLRLIAHHADPELAAALADAYASAAVSTALIANREASDNAVSWLQSQAAAQRKAVERADMSLLGFREEYNLESLQSRKKTVEHALLSFNESLVAMEREAALMRDLVEELIRMEVTPEMAGQLPSSTPRAEEIATLFEEFAQVGGDRAALLARYTEEHPKVIEQQNLMDALRPQLVSAISRAKATAESNLALLTEQVDSLTQKKNERETLAGSLELEIARATMQLNALEREREAADISYRGLLTRIEEARISADENTATIKFVEPALVPAKPVSPRKARIFFFALICGMVAGCIVVIISDRLDDHIWNAVDIEQGLGLKLLGVIPHVQSGNRRELALAGVKNRFGRITEAFAGIRGFLGTGPYRDVSEVMLVVSSAPEAGKTVVSTNLATSYALGGRRTLLVDMDLRRPQLKSIFDLPDKTGGLMRALADKDKDALFRLPHPTEISQLDVIVTHPDQNLNPAELLGSHLIGELITWAKQEYECVIIDSPPLGAVSDSVVLGALVDGVILVCRPRTTRKWATQTVLRHLQDAGARVLGAVLNDVSFSSGGYKTYGGANGYPDYSYYTHRSDEAPAEEEVAATR